MLTRKTAVLFTLALAATGVAATTPGTAAAAPCRNGGSCAISGHYHGGGGGGGGTGGGGGGGGNTGPGLGCPTNQGPQVVCNPGQPGPVAQPRVPAYDIAVSARDQIVVPPPHVHTAPAGRTYVQLKTGLWVDGADFGDYSITLPPVTGETVTATAHHKEVVWKMGEGSVTCYAAGTPGGTSCGYSYDRSSAAQPNGKYQISATVVWRVTWHCDGPCDQTDGTLDDMTMTTAAPLAVGEIQTESNRG